MLFYVLYIALCLFLFFPILSDFVVLYRKSLTYVLFSFCIFPSGNCLLSFCHLRVFVLFSSLRSSHIYIIYTRYAAHANMRTITMRLYDTGRADRRRRRANGYNRFAVAVFSRNSRTFSGRLLGLPPVVSPPFSLRLYLSRNCFLGRILHLAPVSLGQHPRR